MHRQDTTIPYNLNKALNANFVYSAGDGDLMGIFDDNDEVEYSKSSDSSGDEGVAADLRIAHDLELEVFPPRTEANDTEANDTEANDHIDPDQNFVRNTPWTNNCIALEVL